MIYLFLILLAVLAVFAVLCVVKEERLSEELEECSKYRAALEERESRLAEWEEALRSSKEFSVTYCLSKSDELLHSTETSAVREAKRRAASTLANDILRAFEPIEEGNRITYRLKVRRWE